MAWRRVKLRGRGTVKGYSGIILETNPAFNAHILSPVHCTVQIFFLTRWPHLLSPYCCLSSAAFLLAPLFLTLLSPAHSSSCPLLTPFSPPGQDHSCRSKPLHFMRSVQKPRNHLAPMTSRSVLNSTPCPVVSSVKCLSASLFAADLVKVNLVLTYTLAAAFWLVLTVSGYLSNVF